ncbi:MAG: hypothetical protein ACR2PT_08235 [Endozoicomonas sp.]
MDEKNRKTFPFLAGAVDAFEGQQHLEVANWESVNDLLTTNQNTAQWLNTIQTWQEIQSWDGLIHTGHLQAAAVWLLPDMNIWHTLNNGQFHDFLLLIIYCHAYRAFERINVLLLLQLLVQDSQESSFSNSLQLLLIHAPETAQAVLTNLENIKDSSAQSLSFFTHLVRFNRLEALLKRLQDSGYNALKHILLKWLFKKSKETSSLEAAQLTINWLNSLNQNNSGLLLTLNQLPEEQILQALDTHQTPGFSVNDPEGNVAPPEVIVPTGGIVIDGGSNNEQHPSLGSGFNLDEIEEALAEALQETAEDPPIAATFHSPFDAEVEEFQVITPADCW